MGGLCDDLRKETTYQAVLAELVGTGPLAVTLEAGTYAAEWFDVDRRAMATADPVTVASRDTIGFSAPFPAPGGAVLHLKRAAR